MTGVITLGHQGSHEECSEEDLVLLGRRHVVDDDLAIERQRRKDPVDAIRGGKGSGLWKQSGEARVGAVVKGAARLGAVSHGAAALQSIARRAARTMHQPPTTRRQRRTAHDPRSS